MPRTPLGALLCAVVFACSSPAERPASVWALSSAADAGPVQADLGDGVGEVIRCLEEGRFEEARKRLDQLLWSDSMARARNDLAAGVPEDALTAVDRALVLAPDNLETRLLKADASLRLGETKIRSGGGSAGLIEGVLTDALDAYEGAGESAHALLGASRAAWLLGRSEEALGFARRGVTLLAHGESVPAELGLAPERIYAEQVFAAYTAARDAAREDRAALALESEDALGRLLGRVSDDPWVWSHLAELYEGEGSLAAAKETIQRALKRFPEDGGLIERLARVSEAFDGPAATVTAFEAHVAAHPEVALGRWQLAAARLRLALAAYRATPRELDPAPFAHSEQEFRALREALPEYANQALVHEAVCRLARGWCAFHAGDLVRARDEFLSMNELFERGIESSWPGELESGIQGLYFIADAYQPRPDGSNPKADALAAGETFETLHQLQPESWLWANDAGLDLRDAADALESEGRKLCRAARGELTNAEALAELRPLLPQPSALPGSLDERQAFARAANERFERARAIMERSYAAYRPAAELAPDDVQVQNDAALVALYYLHRDVDWAEQTLRRAIELGERQLAAKKEALRVEELPERAAALENELKALESAWGDAHQNMGVLEWIYRKDGAAALPWLEKSLTLGPDRRAVKNSLLPQVRGEPMPDDIYWDLLNWAQPCDIP
ncbi:MAG: hypothetical protein EXS08_01850 [Planctomycetes bacterium]|nr:hypothetical protein [Planctomycetota bacterium]